MEQDSWGVEEVLGNWRRCRESGGGAWGQRKVLREWGSAGGVEEVQEGTRGALGAGQDFVGVEEVLGE